MLQEQFIQKFQDKKINLTFIAISIQHKKVTLNNRGNSLNE